MIKAYRISGSSEKWVLTLGHVTIGYFDEEKAKRLKGIFSLPAEIGAKLGDSYTDNEKELYEWLTGIKS